MEELDNSIKELEKQLDQTEDFDKRKELRNKIRELKKKRSDERDALIKKHEQSREDRLKTKVAVAGQRKKEEMERLTGIESVGAHNVGVMQHHIERAKLDADRRKAAELKMYDEKAKADSAGVSKRTTSIETKTGKDGLKTTTKKTTIRSNDPKEVDKLASEMTKMGGTGGQLKITKTTTTTKDGKVTTDTKTETKTLGAPTSPYSPLTPTTPGGGPGLQRSPSTVKDMVLAWSQAKTRGYEHVDIQNFSGSWANGMAFCALIHYYFPKAFNYGKLNPKNRKGNFKLAFKVAEDLAGVYPLLDVEDMLLMGNKPDWKCVFTYVQALYRALYDKQPVV